MNRENDFLSERKRKILEAIIDDYIETAEPVGSRSIARHHGLDLSPATIRNEMADLEEMGYLDKPHTSAGRIPSHMGYRFYVDSLMQQYEMTAIELKNIRDAMALRMRELDRMISDLSEKVSRLTQYTTFATTPMVEGGSLKSFSMLPLDDESVLMIVVTDDGRVKNKQTKAPSSVTDGEIKLLSNLLDQKLCGLSAKEIDALHLPELSFPEEDKKALICQAEEFIKEALAPTEEVEVFLDGAANIFNHPEYKDVDKAKHFLDFVEDKKNIRSLLSGKQGKPIVIAIGDENGFEEMKDCSLIVSQYTTKNGQTGSIGIIGPTRMDYAKVSSSLQCIADGISKLINGFYLE